MTTVHSAPPGPPAAPSPKPEAQPDLVPGQRHPVAHFVLYLIVGLPSAALVALPLMLFSGWISLLDVCLLMAFYVITTAGIGIGFHRLFTHGAFKAKRALKIALAVAGSLAIEGDVIDWVSDHRRHHRYSDKEGDPHSPWRFGDSTWGMLKGLGFAHIGWMFSRERRSAGSNPKRFSPDLLADRDLRVISRLFPVLVLFSLFFPPLLGGLVTWSWQGALSAFFWGTLVRVSLMHHVTWSTNSIAHRFGNQPFESNDHSTNVWWLAIASFGESWHNLHHAWPSMARHGVGRGQIDINAEVIRICEKLGWAYKVNWPTADQLNRKRVAA